MDDPDQYIDRGATVFLTELKFVHGMGLILEF